MPSYPFIQLKGKAMKKLILSTVVLLSALASSIAQAVDKIATVNLEKVVICHPETANNKKTLEDMQTRFEKQRSEERAKLNKLRDSFELATEKAEDPASSESARATSLNTAKEIYAELVKKDEEVRNLSARLQRNLTDTEMNLFEGTMKDVNAKLEKIAKAKGIALVIDTSAGRIGAPVPVVLYSAPSIDITDELVKATGGSLALYDTKR